MAVDRMKALPEDIQKHLAAHVELYQRDPERAHIWDSSVIGVPGPVKTLLLRTKGRKSGDDRYVTLQYFRPENLYVIVGSKGGVADHPAWFLNLLDEPRCHMQVGAFSSDAVARVAKGDERDRLWAMVSEEQPQYRRYQARTSREIPIIVLNPTASKTAS
ncbi:nitroreductase family deazaflavin-dependent oxidoreductase [Sphingobium lactosutens]|uniref:nitroreductase family deazaflavin-dependent oxidoreductase n=1 Tax=Sphingobium lactosutens TaxID=522773 RepID=UPI0015BF41F1|nr:nitroreductase family deazaflavin-dependent oxidoreductase [Sphingobium lactosutens]NWK98323.1 nitroreductase family deazaflavin-dependent oxidoreductase [Sphingobium lactosutens]